MAKQPTLHNAHLDSGPFFWEGGPVGVLLSHGYTATAAEVRLLGQRLFEHGYTVSGPLLPGHGTTPAEMNRCRWQDWTAALEAAYQSLAARCQQVFVGGESMGALLALLLAAGHRDIAGVLAYAPAMRIRRRSRIMARLLWPFVRQVAKKDLATIDRNWQGYPVNPVPALAQLVKLQQAVSRRLPQIEQPLLLVGGRRDTAIDLRGIDQLYEKIGSKTKELHWLERTGHLVMLEPDEFDQVLQITLNFLKRVGKKEIERLGGQEINH